MRTLAFSTVAAGILALGVAGGAAAAPISSPLPPLRTLSDSQGGVEQVNWRRCHWVTRCNVFGRCWSARRCHRW